MEKYITQILEKNSRVIVPEFGAFIVKQRTPLTIVFNEFLQYNDGMLVDTIAKGENVDRDAAKEKIDAFVKNITTALGSGNSFSIPGLGTLVKSATGKISLETSLGETSKIEASAPPKKTTSKAEEKPAAKPSTTSDKSEKTDSKTDSKETKADEEKSSSAKKPEPAKAKTATPPKANNVTEEKKTEPKVVSQPAPEPKKTYASTSSSEKSTSYSAPSESNDAEFEGDNQRKRSNLLLWILVIVLINGGIITYFYFSGQLSGLFSKNDEIEEFLPTDETTPIDSTSEELGTMQPMIEEAPVQTEAPQQAVKKVTPTPKPKATVSGTRYYVVAGVFSVEGNADNLVNELISRGYDAEKFGKIGNLHAVSYGVFSSRSAAEQFLTKIKNSENPNSWIKTVN